MGRGVILTVPRAVALESYPDPPLDEAAEEALQVVLDFDGDANDDAEEVA